MCLLSLFLLCILKILTMYVYGLFKTNDKPTFKDLFYVGITKNIKQRIKGHKREDANWSPIKDKMIKKYGFNFRLLFIVATREESVEREIFLIRYFGRKNLKTGQLANLTDGGDGMLNAGDEVYEKRTGMKNSERLRYIDEFKKSGLSKTEFCKINNINRANLYGWTCKYEPSLVKKTYKINHIHTEDEKLEIIKEYQESNLSIEEFSNKKGINRTTICRWKNKYGLVQSLRKFSKEELDNLADEYRNSNLSPRNFSKLKNVPRGTIERIAETYSIYRRTKRYDSDFKIKMYNQYKESGLSIPEFAKTINIKYATVYEWVRKFDKQKANNE